MSVQDLEKKAKKLELEITEVKKEIESQAAPPIVAQMKNYLKNFEKEADSMYLKRNFFYIGIIPPAHAFIIALYFLQRLSWLEDCERSKNTKIAITIVVSNCIVLILRFSVFFYNFKRSEK